MEFHTKTIAIFPRSERKLEQLCYTLTVLRPTRANSVVECGCKKSLNLLWDNPLDFQSSQTYRMPFRFRITLIHLSTILDLNGRLTPSKEPPRTDGGPDSWYQTKKRIDSHNSALLLVTCDWIENKREIADAWTPQRRRHKG